ncbi:hydrogen peroxide-inducible genes activator [Woodsholea maritima]|uniref:hydrogen peroxide-inducible genes activator n=1 Tax=Woodsholea maritima TaxID=240237 RepID=UPI000364F4FE|nr:hydrogen peroxide-inducible genes activator [Woodsholea maritima]
MRPTLRQLEYIIAVAETGRFSDAALRAGVSQPSLSVQIQEAESYLKAQIFERGRQGAFLTPMGQEVVRRARAIVRQVEDLREFTQHHGQSVVGRFRLGVLPTIGPYLLPRCTKALHHDFPHLRLSIRDERPFELEEKLQDGRFDFVISCPDDHPGSPHFSLFEERLWACMPPDDDLAQDKGPLDPMALRHRELLSLGMGHRLTLLVHRLADQFEAHLSTDYEGTSLDTIRQMAALGAGIAILPELYVRCEAERDESLVFREIKDPGARRLIALIWRPHSESTTQFQAIGQLLRTAGQAALKRD